MLFSPSLAVDDVVMQESRKKFWFVICLVMLMSLFYVGTAFADELEDEEDIAKKPFVEFNGYFRFRGEIYENFSLGVSPLRGIDSTQNSIPPYGAFPFLRPTRAYTLNDKLRKGSEIPSMHTFGNMRFRLHTTFNISEDVRIISKFDFLDNVVMGSNPRGNIGMLQDPFIPILAFSDTQVPPTNGINGFSDSVRVREVYADVRLPVGVLRVGRMASNWGLGLLANSGSRINSDYGDVNDRVLFATQPLAPFIARIQSDKTRLKMKRLFNPALIIAMDFVASGPTSSLQSRFLGQPFDLDPSDDARQLIFALAHLTREKELRDRTEAGEHVINYGLYFVYRWQNFSSECLPNGTCAKGKPVTRGVHPSAISMNKRDANAYIPDVWFRWLHGEKMRLEFEGVMILGSVGNGPNNEPIDIFQWGAGLEFEYRLLDGDLRLGVQAGAASGDSDFFSRWVFNPDSDGTKSQNKGRAKVNNFKFDPDYNVDMILWKELYGTVSNAFYAKMNITYCITGDPWDKYEEGGLGLRFSTIYSQALNERATLGLAAPLGIELNGILNYASRDGYGFMFTYALLVPLSGLDRAIYTDVKNQTGRKVEEAASLAHRFQFLISLKFGNKYGF